MTRSPVKIIFDLDGTLIDSAPLCAELLTEMLAERASDRVVTATETRRHLTRGGAQLVAALLGSDGDAIETDLVEFRARYAARRTPATCLYPGVAEGLSALSRLGVGMAICSNKPQELCDKIVADLGLGRHCPIVVGATDGVPLKPAATLALMALEQLGTAPVDCLYVGDSEVDSLTAANAGIGFLFANWGYAESGGNIDALARFDHFDDVVRYVSERSARAFDRRRAG